MIFEQTDRLTADEMPYERQRMFALTHHFAFTAAQAPRMTTQRADVAGIRLFRVRSTGHRVRLTEQENTTFLMPRRGTIEVRTGRQTLVARAGDALLFSPNMRATTVVPDSSGAFACDCLLVPTATAAEADAPARLLRPHAGEWVLSGSLAGGRDVALRSYLGFLFDEGMRPESHLARPRVRGTAGMLVHELLGELIDRLEDTGARGLASAQEVRLVRSAEDLMVAQLDHPLTIGELAGCLGISVRKLQYAFQSVRNATPRVVLNHFRLEAARQRLADPHENRTVAEVALDCGVAHFGRFAAAYAARYGELPSETLRRAQRR